MVKREKGLPSFLQNGQRLVAPVKKPASQSKESLPETNAAVQAESTQQANLDQDKHDQWLESRTPQQLGLLAQRARQWLLSKDK
jgi:hypothetical protein